MYMSPMYMRTYFVGNGNSLIESRKRNWNMARTEWILLIGEGMALPETDGIQITYLLGNYAIARLEEEKETEFLRTPGILYAERSTRIFEQVESGRGVSCINNRPTAQSGAETLSGKGVLMGILDSGIDYAHPDFRNDDGTTRIVALWDQTTDFGSPPEGYFGGTLFSREQIDLALVQETAEERRRIVPSTDLSGHGTHVAGIAAGNGRASEGKYRGVAFESELLIVKLARSGSVTASDTASLMEGIDFCMRYAIARNQPLVLNFSYGTNEGAHNGKSLLETYLNTVIPMAKCVACVGTGNEGVGRTHAGGRVWDNAVTELELAVEGQEQSIDLRLWKNFADQFSVEVEAPGQGSEVQVAIHPPTVYQNLEEIRMHIVARGERLGSGIWKIRLVPENIVHGEYDIWILRGLESRDSGFVSPTPERTLTIPSTAENVISVGAYDFGTFQVAPFSGRGEARESGRNKPDLVAPGVGIISCAPGGGYTALSGTSMATPFVSGGAALFMEWGIIEGKDIFLYGEKLREYLLRGAVRLPGETYPNPVAGWGRLCVADSLPYV